MNDSMPILTLHRWAQIVSAARLRIDDQQPLTRNKLWIRVRWAKKIQKYAADVMDGNHRWESFYDKG